MHEDPELGGQEQLIHLLEAADNHFMFLHFMDLPPELRALVLGWALLHTEDGIAARFWPQETWSYQEYMRTMAPTRLCQGLRKEALPIFYSINTSPSRPKATAT